MSLLSRGMHSSRSAVGEVFKLLGSKLRSEALDQRAQLDQRSDFSWCSSAAIEAISTPLPGASPAQHIDVWITRDARPRDIPQGVWLANRWVTFRPRSGSRPVVQVATASNADSDSGFGTIAALVRDRLHPDRHYVLSCGHVFAGSSSARVGDQIQLSMGATQGIARLVDWEPFIGTDILRTGIDAAIARVDEPSLLTSLRGMSLPRSIASSFTFEQSVVLKANTEKAGQLKSRWSGYVDIEGNSRDRDYFMEDAIGYTATPTTDPGDSGAAVWDAATDDLLGIHVAAPVGDERFRSNAIFCPIDRIVDWFDVEPITRGGAAAAFPSSSVGAARASRVEAIAPSSDREVEVVAKTLWGEARGEGEAGMRAVACVIGNRASRKWRGKVGCAAVCLDKWQFSCWNDNDPNRGRMDAVARNPDEKYSIARVIAVELVGNRLADFTFGATHYYATTLKQRPYWAVGKNACYQQGNHLFFNDIG